MKISLLAVALAAATPTLGFNYGGGYPKNGFRGPPFASERQRRQVDRAFDDLEQELRNRRQKRASRRMDGEEMIRKQKEWVNKAFDFAKELNQDFAETDTEAKQNDVDLEQVREWINRAYGMGFEETDIMDDDCTSDDSAAVVADATTPNFEIRSTDSMFQVAVDAPGVERDEIEIAIDDIKSILNIEYERNGKAFAKSFEIDDSVITTSISAELKNGVLMISAPKKLEDEEEKKARKIPII